MSEFDEEAERERLREKYAADEQDREATRRMSDLLLQGATMTNTHCDTCGDPLFRHDGQEFCPTCQTAAADANATPSDHTSAGQQSTAREQSAQEQPATPNQSTQQGQPASRDQPDSRDQSATPDHPGRQHQVEPQDGSGTQNQSATPTDTRSTSTRAGSADPDTSQPAATPANEPREANSSPEVTGQRTPEAGDLDAVEASLSRTLAGLASEAETGDVAATRERLAAVREAAAALDAVRDARR